MHFMTVPSAKVMLHVHKTTSRPRSATQISETRFEVALESKILWIFVPIIITANEFKFLDGFEA